MNVRSISVVLTLLAAGLVPQVDRVLITSWPDVLAIIDRFIAEDTGHHVRIAAVVAFAGQDNPAAGMLRRKL